MVKSKDDYERELGMINMKIENLEQTTQRIEGKLDKFIECADNKYATKEELDSLKEENKWNRGKIMDIFYKIGVIAGILGLGLKAVGLW
jgi:hypothetical protein